MTILFGVYYLFIFLAVLYLLYKHYVISNKKKSILNYTIFWLRFIIVIYLLILVVNPKYQYSITDKINSLDVVIDNSKSMKSHSKILDTKLTSLIDKINNWSKKEQIFINWYQLSDTIAKTKIDKYNFNGSSTNYSSLPFFQRNTNNSILLLSDGVLNTGQGIKSLKFNNTNPIYTIGYGNRNYNDLSIVDFQIAQSDINSNVIIESSININSIIDTILLASILNNNNKLIFSDKININKGKYLMNLNFQIPHNQLTTLNYIQLDTLPNEINYENNIKKFQFLNDYENQFVLLITGSLSNNTRMVLNILNNIENITYKHFWKNNNNWNEMLSDNFIDSASIIILDNLNNNDFDHSLSSILKQENKKLYYFEGPNKEFISDDICNKLGIKQKLNFNKSQEKKIVNSNIIKIDFDKFIPQQTYFSVFSNHNKFKNSVLYEDSSYFYIDNKNMVAFFMPALYKIYSIEKDIIADFLESSFIKGINQNTRLINFSLNKKKYMLHENIYFKILNNSNINYDDLKIKIFDEKRHYDKTFTSLDSISFFTISDTGYYKAFTYYIDRNGSQITSDTLSFNIIDYDLEIMDVSLNEKSLIYISKESNGLYESYNNIDSLLNVIHSEPILKTSKYSLNAFSFFPYWILIVFLFIIEWIIRKYIGMI